MASQETVKITTKRWSPRFHTDGYHCRRTSHGDREDYRKPYRTKPTTKTLTEWRTKGSRNYRRTAFRTECQSSLPETYQMTTEQQTDIQPKLPTEMAQRIGPRMHRSYHPNDFHREVVHRDPTKWRIKTWRELQMQCTKRLSESRSALVTW